MEAINSQSSSACPSVSVAPDRKDKGDKRPSCFLSLVVHQCLDTVVTFVKAKPVVVSLFVWNKKWKTSGRRLSVVRPCRAHTVDKRIKQLVVIGLFVLPCETHGLEKGVKTSICRMSVVIRTGTNRVEMVIDSTQSSSVYPFISADTTG